MTQSVFLRHSRQVRVKARHLRHWLKFWQLRTWIHVMNFMTIFVSWYLRVTPDSIRNSCNVFLTSPIFRDKPTFAALSWLWSATTIVLIICTPKWPTHSESWIGALSHGTTHEKKSSQKCRGEGTLAKKRRFWPFSVSSTLSKVKNCYWDNFDASGLPHGSFDALWAKVK